MAVAVLFTAVAACGGSKAAPSGDKTYNQSSVWQASSAERVQAQRACFSIAVTPECFAEQMEKMGAPAEALDFYRSNKAVLVGFKSTGGRVDVGWAEIPFRDVAGELLLLNCDPPFQVMNELLGANPERLIASDATYAELVAAKTTPSNTVTTSLTFWLGDERLEAASKRGADGQRLVFQLGLHDICRACGVGVAAPLAFPPDAGGRLKTTTLLDFCQGRLRTEQILGKQTTFHDFAGLRPGESEGSSVTEPYLITIPKLQTCPPETKVAP